MKMTTDEFYNAVQIALEANIPLCGWGSTGVGKSAITNQACREVFDRTAKGEGYLYHTRDHIKQAVESDLWTYRYEDLRLASMTEGEWGIPRTYHVIDYTTANGSRLRKTVPETALQGLELDSYEIVDSIHRNTRPNWFPDADFPGLVVFNFEELNRAQDVAINAIMSITAERTLQGRKAPVNSALFALNNPNTGGFKTKQLDAAMLARFSHIYVESNREAYLKHRADYLDPISAEIANDAAFALSVEEALGNWDISQQTKMNPRTFELFSNLGNYILERDAYQKMVDPSGPRWGDMNRNILKKMMQGLRQSSDTVSWWNLYDSGLTITREAIMNGSVTYAQLSKHGSRIAYAVHILSENPTDIIFRDANGHFDQKRAKNFASFMDSLCGGNPSHKGRRELASTFIANLSRFGKNNPQTVNITKILSGLKSYQEYSQTLAKSMSV